MVSQDSPKLLTNDSPLMCVPNPMNLPQKSPTLSQEPLFWFSKIHILKLWTSHKDPQPLVSKTLKVLSFGFHEIHQAYPTNGSKNAYIVFRFGQNRVTVDAYDPRYDQPYLENVASMPKIVSRFPKSCHV